jgi:hypothetical protein
MGAVVTSFTKAVLLLAAAAATAFGHGPAQAQKAKPNRIATAYVTPTNPAHTIIYEQLRQRDPLRKFKELLSPIRLPRQLTLRFESCGESNASYGDDIISVCYEFVEEVFRNAPKETTPAGVTFEDAIFGPMTDVFLHEAGHALIDMLELPVLGREEDAADLISAYMMLQFDKTEGRRLIIGTAYQYKADVSAPVVSLPLKKFSDEHGHPVQRFFNVLCIAYGADPKLFADVVEKGFLPKERAEQCEDEHTQIAHAFDTLIVPHVDPKLRKTVWNKKRKWLPSKLGVQLPASN